MHRLPFIRHRMVNQIRSKYRACWHPIEKVRWHAGWLPAQTDEARTPARVASPVGLSAVTVRDLLHRWNTGGPDGVADRRRHNGAAPKLSPQRRAALYAALQKRPPDGGVWAGPKVAWYVRDRWQVVVRPETGWRWLRDLGFAPQVPRLSHPRAATPTARRACEKGVRRRVRRLQATKPGEAIEVWAQDEARGGLKRITRRVWWRKGYRPRSCGRTWYEWLSV